MSAPTRKETTPSFARVQHILSLCNVSSLPGILDLLDKGDTASAFDKDDAFPVAGPWKKKPSEGGQARGSSQQQRKAPQRQRKKYKRNQKKKKTKGHADEGAAISPTNTKLPNDSDVVMHDAPPSVENNAEEISADNASLSLHGTEPQQTQQPVEETAPTETGVMPEAGSEEKPTETLAGTPPAQSDNTLANTLHSNHNISSSSLNGLEKPQTVAQPEASPMQLEETTPEQEAAPMHPQPVSIPPATLPTYTPPPHSQPYPLQPYAIVIPQYYWHPSVVYPQGSWPYMFVQNPVYSKRWVLLQATVKLFTHSTAASASMW